MEKQSYKDLRQTYQKVSEEKKLQKFRKKKQSNMNYQQQLSQATYAYQLKRAINQMRKKIKNIN